MRTTESMFVLAACILLLTGGYAQTIQHHAFNNGAGRSEGMSHGVFSIAGQPIVGRCEDASHTVQAGFCPQAIDNITAVERLTNARPETYRLEQNFPNPFNPTTTIVFSIPKTSLVTLKLFDIRSREIATLTNQEMTPGEYEVRYDATGLPSGVYLYRISAGEFMKTRRLMVLK